MAWDFWPLIDIVMPWIRGGRKARKSQKPPQTMRPRGLRMEPLEVRQMLAIVCETMYRTVGQNQSAHFEVSFSDDNTSATQATAIVDFGDSYTTTASCDWSSSGPKTLAFDHTYSSVGNFGLSISIVDDQNDLGTGYISVNSIVPPQAAEDSVSLSKNSPASIYLLSNDTYRSEITPIVEIVSPPSNGAVAYDSSSGWQYTPTPDFTGSDSFSYCIWDGAAYSNTANVYCTVNANDPCRPCVARGGLSDGGDAHPAAPG